MYLERLMLKRFTALLIVVTALVLQSCVGAGVGLQSFTDTYDGYRFLYPTGWTEVKVAGSADVVFHDIVNETENISVVISDVPDGQSLKELGTPTEVGYKLSKSINAIAGDRDVELANAIEIDRAGEPYYILEYIAELRHNLASVVVRRDKLFTFNASTEEERWDKMADLMKQSVASFSVD